MNRLIAASLVSLVLAGPAYAETAEVLESVATTVDAHPWEAEVGFKFTGDQQKTDRALSYLGYIAPSYRLNPSWKLGLTTEAETITQSGEQTNHWNDSWLILSNDGLPVGESVTILPRAMSLLPTKREERDAGLLPSIGLGSTAEFTPTGDWKLDYDLEGIRLFRDGAKAAFRADPEQPAAADGLDRWRLNQRVGVAYQLYRDLWLQGNATHAMNWRWFGGRETLIGFEQIFTYGWDNWTFGLGHRGETVVHEASGETRALAFSRPEGSTFFGTVSYRL
jgi:hypothetical protein